MENVVLTIHLILALLLIGAVLLQRSEGGALGMGGGGGGGGGNVMSGRSAATALQKATWGLCAAFIVTSLVLTVFATQTARDEDVLDRLRDGGGATAPIESLPALPTIDLDAETAPADGAANSSDGLTPPAAAPTPDAGGADPLSPPTAAPAPSLPDLGN